MCNVPWEVQQQQSQQQPNGDKDGWQVQVCVGVCVCVCVWNTVDECVVHLQVQMTSCLHQRDGLVL